MYVTFGGWEYDEGKVILKVVLHQKQSGRMFRKILNVHYVMLEKDQFSEVE